jgi:hypothetical protein
MGWLKRLCAALALLKDEGVVSTLGELDTSVTGPAAPTIAPFRPAARKVVHALNELPWLSGLPWNSKHQR